MGAVLFVVVGRGPGEDPGCWVTAVSLAAAVAVVTVAVVVVVVELDVVAVVDDSCSWKVGLL